MEESLLLLGIKGTELSCEEATLYKKLKPAGYILFTRNITSAPQLRRLSDDLRDLSYEDPIIAIDQEGGRVTRTSEIGPALPSAAAFCAKPIDSQIARAGDATAEMLLLLGINFNLAPVLDIDHFPEHQNALRQRCWGRNSQDILDRAGVWNRWARKRGIITCGKHFPACGRALCDPHEDLPFSAASKEEIMRDDIIPYTALGPELDAIMLAHVIFPKIDPKYPASLSKLIVNDWLRDQLGFKNQLVLTDDLDMGAIQKRYGRGEDAKLAIAAGNDLALICHQIETAELAAKAISELPEDILEAAQRRVTHFKKKLTFPPAFSENAWNQVCEKIQAIRGEVPEPEPADTRSSVTRY